jgi:UDP-N-acetyl-D-mannosaminuronic acid transferase (WecB/TagA/CpsF family)
LACQQNDLSLFLLGGKSGVAQEAVRKLKIVAPNLKVPTHHGYFQKTGSENDQMIRTGARNKGYRPIYPLGIKRAQTDSLCRAY